MMFSNGKVGFGSIGLELLVKVFSYVLDQFKHHSVLSLFIRNEMAKMVSAQ